MGAKQLILFTEIPAGIKRLWDYVKPSYFRQCVCVIFEMKVMSWTQFHDRQRSMTGKLCNYFKVY